MLYFVVRSGCVGSSLRGNQRSAVAGGRRAGGRVQRQAQGEDRGREEGPGPEGDRHQAPTETGSREHRQVPGGMHPGPVLLHHHGVLSVRATVQPAAGGRVAQSPAVHGLGQGGGPRHGLLALAQDHPPRPKES